MAANNKYRKRGKSNKFKDAKPNIKDQERLTDTGGDSRNTPTSNVQPDKLSSLNDMSWYNRYPELLAAAASVPFPYKPGMSVNVGSVVNKAITTPAVSPVKVSVPGILALRWLPCIPRSSNATDPASVAAREIYGRVRKAYSGRLYADPPDFVMYLMALDSIYSYIGWLNRVYRTICAYTPENYFTPDGILGAMNLDTSTITNMQLNQIQLFQCINELVHMCSKFNCPGEFDLMKRHYWMNMNVYADAPGLNSQLYMFNMYAIWKFGLVNTPDGVPAGGLVATAIPTQNATVSSLYEFGKGLIDALSGWEDSYTISGYLSRAFEGSPQFMPEFPTLNDAITFEYQPEVLLQIENSFTDVGIPYTEISSNSLTISQDPKTNSIIFQPEIDPVGYVSTTRTDLLQGMINVHTKSHPNVEDVVISTRLRTMIDTRSYSNTVFPIPSNVKFSIITGTEWFGGYSLRNFSGNQIVNQRAAFANDMVIDLSDTSVDPTISVEVIACMRQFDWAPLMRVIVINGAKTRQQVIYSWDQFNTTIMSKEDLENIHRICAYSEFNAFSI